MNRGFANVWLIVGLVVILGGVAAWWAMSQKSNTPATTTTVQQPSTNGSPESLNDFLALRGSWKCTFVENSNPSYRSKTVYVADGKLRGVSLFMSEGGNGLGYLIVRDGMAYVWGEGGSAPEGVEAPPNFKADGGAPQGTKMSTKNMGEKEKTFIDGFLFNYPSGTGAANYSCTQSNVSESQFLVPSYITFYSDL